MSRKKFARGWGSVSPYRDGQYRVRIYIQGRREERILPTEALANATLEAFRRRKVQIESGAATPAGMAEDVRIKDVWPELYASMQAGTKRVYSKTTLKDYLSEFRALDRDMGSRKIASLKQRDVDQLIMRMRTAGFSSSHIRHILDRLAQTIKFSVAMGYISQAPLPVERPKYRQRSVAWCATEKELSILIGAAKTDFDRRALPAILVAADAGLRVSEIANLRVVDVDLKRGCFHVENRAESTDRTKSGQRRIVPILTPRLRSALMTLTKDRKPDERLFGVSTRDGLDGIAGGPWRVLGREPAWHGLRRRFASWRADSGDSLPVLQRWLGHQGISTTMHYVRVPDEALLRGALGEQRRGAKKK